MEPPGPILTHDWGCFILRELRINDFEVIAPPHDHLREVLKKYNRLTK
jgi:hypothetical protein